MAPPPPRSLGLRRGGQSIASLQQALHAATVRIAVTSLWKVPDEATRDLLAEFYRRMWVPEEPKHEALWKAKQLIRNEREENGTPVHQLRHCAAWVMTEEPD